MPSYRTNVGIFDVPDTWEDQSIVAFRLPRAPGGGDASFVMTKDAGKGVTPFDRYVETQAGNCSRSLPDYRELRRELMQANERNAAWLEFQWTKDQTVMQLRQIYFDCGFFSVICTLTSAPQDIAFHEAEWRRLMGSLVFDPPAIATAFP